MMRDNKKIDFLISKQDSSVLSVNTKLITKMATPQTLMEHDPTRWISWALGTLGLPAEIIDKILWKYGGIRHKNLLLWDKEIEINLTFPGIVTLQMLHALRPDLYEYCDKLKYQGQHRFVRMSNGGGYNPIQTAGIRIIHRRGDYSPAGENYWNRSVGHDADNYAKMTHKYTSSPGILGCGHRPPNRHNKLLGSVEEVREYMPLAGLGRWGHRLHQHSTLNTQARGRVEKSLGNTLADYNNGSECYEGIIFEPCDGRDPEMGLNYISLRCNKRIRNYEVQTDIWANGLMPHIGHDHHKSVQLKQILRDNHIDFKNSWNKSKLIKAYYKSMPKYI